MARGRATGRKSKTKKLKNKADTKKKKVLAMQRNRAKKAMRAKMPAGEKKLAGANKKKQSDKEAASKVPNTSNASDGGSRDTRQ